METTIAVPVDEEVAALYRQAPPELQKKMQLLLSLWVREWVQNPRSLTMVMDEIAQKAAERGLTAQVLENLLDDE